MVGCSTSCVAFYFTNSCQQELGGTQNEAMLLTPEGGTLVIFLFHQGHQLIHAR